MVSSSTAAGSRPASPLAALEYWRFLAFGRVVPAVLFGFLGYHQWQGVVSSIVALPPHAGFGDVTRGPLPRLLYLLFCVLPVGIYMVRPRPKARDGRIVARVAAFVGTLMLLGVNAYLPSPTPLFHEPDWVVELSSPLLVAAYALAVWGLAYLRKSFSIIPEARRVVSGGPYRLIRHPLYAAEIMAAFAVVLAWPAPWPVVAFPMFVAVQLLRSVFEERLLSRTFPEYRDYATRTWRIIPFVF